MTHKILQIVTAVTAISIAGCGAFVPVVKLDRLPPERQHAARNVKILNSNQLTGNNFEVISIVEGHSCQNQSFDPPASRTGAIEQLKYFASEAGATGITNIQCGGREGTSLRTNCWQLISCTAEAIRFK